MDKANAINVNRLLGYILKGLLPHKACVEALLSLFFLVSLCIPEVGKWKLVLRHSGIGNIAYRVVEVNAAVFTRAEK